MTKVNIMERTEEGHQIMASDTVVGKLFATTDVTTGASTRKVVWKFAQWTTEVIINGSEVQINILMFTNILAVNVSQQQNRVPSLNDAPSFGPKEIYKIGRISNI